MSRKRLLIGAGAVLVLAAIAVAAVTTVRNRPPEVTVAEVTTEDLSVTVVATGRVEADASADVVPPTAGTLESVEVTEGQRVKAGQTLAYLDTEQLEAQLRQAEAAERAARAQLSSVRNAGPTTEQIAQADDAVAQAKQSYRQTEASARSLEEALRQTPQVPQVPGVPSVPSVPTVPDAGIDIDPSVLTDALVGQAYGQYQAAVAQREALNVDTSASEAAAEAQVEQAAEQVRIAQDLLEKATLTAPISGTVLFNQVSSGGLGASGLSATGLSAAGGAGGAGAAAGASALGAAAGGGVSLSSTTPTEGASVSPQQPPFTIVQFDSLRFTAEVDEADVVRIQPNMFATIRLDAFTDREFETTVAKVKPQSQPTATGGTVFPVLLPLYDTGASIYLGMQGDATIRISTVPDAVTIPIEGLQEEGGRRFVYVVADGRLRQRRIETGVITETRAEVTRGLEAGDEVVVSGPEELRDGMRVSVGG